MAHDPPAPRLAQGFRDRGAQVTRLEAFVDAAFAFAVTLLVISFDAMPGSIAALREALKDVPAFALSFLQIALFWRAHVTWSRRYGLDDAVSVWLSLMLVGLVLVYVYPLKILFGTFFSWISGGWIPWPVAIESYSDILDMFVIYGLAFSTLSMCIAALHANAWQQRAALQLDAGERAATLAGIAAWSWGGIVGLLSVGCARQMPAQPAVWLAGLPGLVYFLMHLARPLSAAVERRARRAITPGE